MKIRKIIRESIVQFANKKTDTQASEILNNLCDDINQYGIKYLHSDFLGDVKKFTIDVESKNQYNPYNISLEIGYEITKEPYSEKGTLGSTDTAVAPYFEDPEWKMYLISGHIFDDDGNIVYQGHSVFNKAFKNIYNKIHDFFNDKVVEEEY